MNSDLAMVTIVIYYFILIAAHVRTWWRFRNA